MPLLVTEANKLSQDQLERGVIEEIIDYEELFALFPFMTINGKAYDYNRENQLAEGDFLDPYDVVPEGAATFTPAASSQVCFPHRKLAIARRSSRNVSAME